MKKSNLILVLVSIVISFFVSCDKENNLQTIETDTSISEEVLAQISELGYNTKNISAIDNGNGEISYVVEGDILLNQSHLNMERGEELIIAEEEQYRMTLVPEFGAVITQRDRQTGQIVTINRKENIVVGMNRNLPAIYWAALQGVAARYSAVSGLRFTIIPQLSNPAGCSPCPRYNPDIEINQGNIGFLGLGTPPFERTITTRGGNTITLIEPGTDITLDLGVIGNQNQDALETLIAHEIGHCIGFRHTDYFNRSISCGAGGLELDPLNIGAIHIPGTPTGNSPGSWMLACQGFNVDRPFTGNDRVALRHVHGF